MSTHPRDGHGHFPKSSLEEAGQGGTIRTTPTTNAFRVSEQARCCVQLKQAKQNPYTASRVSYIICYPTKRQVRIVRKQQQQQRAAHVQ